MNYEEYMMGNITSARIQTPNEDWSNYFRPQTQTIDAEKAYAEGKNVRRTAASYLDMAPEVTVRPAHELEVQMMHQKSVESRLAEEMRQYNQSYINKMNALKQQTSPNKVQQPKPVQQQNMPVIEPEKIVHDEDKPAIDVEEPVVDNNDDENAAGSPVDDVERPDISDFPIMNDFDDEVVDDVDDENIPVIPDPREESEEDDNINGISFTYDEENVDDEIPNFEDVDINADAKIENDVETVDEPMIEQVEETIEVPVVEDAPAEQMDTIILEEPKKKRASSTSKTKAKTRKATSKRTKKTT